MATYIRTKNSLSFGRPNPWQKVIESWTENRPGGLVEMVRLENGAVRKADFTTEVMYVFNK